MGPIAAAALTAIFLFLAGCGGGMGRPGHPRALPPYSGHALELFDDSIEARAVGYELDHGSPPPMNDNLFRERAQVGDAVVRARVTTVTSKEEDRGRSWQIGLHTVEKLGGSGPLDPDFTLQVAASGPASGMMRALGPQMIGVTFVAFVREFARPNAPPEESDLHFHLAQDSRATAAAVHSAFAVDKVH